MWLRRAEHASRLQQLEELAIVGVARVEASGGHRSPAEEPRLLDAERTARGAAQLDLFSHLKQKGRIMS